MGLVKKALAKWGAPKPLLFRKQHNGESPISLRGAREKTQPRAHNRLPKKGGKGNLRPQREKTGKKFPPRPKGWKK